MWKNVYRTQLTVKGVTQLKNCFPDGVIHMRAIYYENVLKTRPVQPGRSKLGISKLKILTFQKELKEVKKDKKDKKDKKVTEHKQTLKSQSKSQLSQSNVKSDLVFTELPLKRKQKAKRIPSLEEENLLEPLISNKNEPTNEEMKEMLNTLLDEWDLSRIKQHVQYRRRKKIFLEESTK